MGLIVKKKVIKKIGCCIDPGFVALNIFPIFRKIRKAKYVDDCFKTGNPHFLKLGRKLDRVLNFQSYFLSKG